MHVQHVPENTTGPAWQVTGVGVRRVGIVRWLTPRTALVYRVIGAPGRDASVYASPGLGKHAGIEDLFLVAQDARIEHRRRRAAARCTNDRRVLRDSWAPSTPAEGALAAAAFVVWCWMLVL